MENIKDPAIFFGVKDWVEDNIKYVLGIPARKGYSLNEQWPDETIDKSQKTGLITVRLAELFEEGVYETLKEAGLSVKRKADSGGDITINDRAWEIKTTQGDDMQGATHSAQKPPRYILIKYKLDYDKALSLEGNRGLILEYGIWVSEAIDNNWWVGTASKNNSRTTLRIPVNSGGKINTVIGGINDDPSHGRIYCKLLTEVLV